MTASSVYTSRLPTLDLSGIPSLSSCSFVSCICIAGISGIACMYGISSISGIKGMYGLFKRCRNGTMKARDVFPHGIVSPFAALSLVSDDVDEDRSPAHEQGIAIPSLSRATIAFDAIPWSDVASWRDAESDVPEPIGTCVTTNT